MTNGEIFHVLKDTRDPDWQSWECYDKNDKYKGGNTTLHPYRARAKNNRMRRGVHPDPDQVPSTIDMHKGIVGVSIYWYEYDSNAHKTWNKSGLY